MNIFLIVFCFLGAFTSCSCGNGVLGGQVDQSADLQIRAALCEIENGDFKSAQSTLENVLKKDPRNIYALRLLPGTMARQIKQDTKTPENTALVKKVIESYESTAQNPLFKDELEDINRAVIQLYGMIGADEKSSALLKKAENVSETPKQRAAYYVSMAADSFSCANEISDVAPVKTIVKKAGKEVYLFRKPQKPADFERLKQCAARGSELIGKAIALDPASDTAWSYQAGLTAQLMRIAEMEGRPEEKARLLKESEAARYKFIELSDQRADEQRRADEKRAGSADDGKVLDETELEDLGRELKTYRAEKPLAQIVDRVDVSFGLVEPVAFDESDAPPAEAVQEPARSKEETQKRELKTFAPDGRFSAELPGDVGVSSTGESRIYTAGGNGLSYFILETSSSRELTENEQDAALNVLAWTFVKSVARLSAARGGRNDSFVSELTKKEKFKGLPARFYAYRMSSCRETKEGVMIYVLGRKNNYAIDIRGAAETDQRVQRFLESLKLD